MKGRLTSPFFNAQNMLRTKNLINDLHDVPEEWIFEYYLGIPEKLTGQEIKMFSTFGAEKTPSMYVYFNSETNKYQFNDFSSGKKGSSIYLVKELFNLSFGEASLKIRQDYSTFLSDNKNYKKSILIIEKKYQVVDFTTRAWNINDKKYWTQFRIGTEILNHYNVQPLENYTMTKEGSEKKLVIKGSATFGYFKKDGTLYKVYQPLLKEAKFLKVQTYIQGSDQVREDIPYLVICSSLKDIMAFKKLGFKNADTIAPDSENTMIPERIIHHLNKKYKKICTLFDNDTAGIKSMKKYEEKYEIPFILLQMEKDLSDSVRDHGLDNTRLILYPLLTKALTGTAKQLDI
tara:strand:- start:900 stop:1937 length:1038 start_codon:yes stop_codon:yes gene_type:complete